MSEPRRFAAIGSKDLSKVPAVGKELFKAIASFHGTQKWVCWTGACTGADQLAAELTLEAGGRTHLCLPWTSYEQNWVHGMSQMHSGRVFVDRTDPMEDEAAVATIDLHPNPGALTQGYRRLMDRNYRIVSPAEFVIALPRPPLKGGTAHGANVAEHLGIPVFNLSTPSGRELFMGSEFCNGDIVQAVKSQPTLFDLVGEK